MLYLLLKITHIFFVVLALGTNLTYGFLLYLAGNDQSKTLVMLNTIRWLDKNIANRSYIMVLITGVTMVSISTIAWSSLWIVASLILFVLVALLGITVYAPILKTQILFTEQGKIDTPEYSRISRQSRNLGILVTCMVIVILILMVLRPV